MYSNIMFVHNNIGFFSDRVSEIEFSALNVVMNAHPCSWETQCTAGAEQQGVYYTHEIIIS
jgi:hypothetical protein